MSGCPANGCKSKGPKIREPRHLDVRTSASLDIAGSPDVRSGKQDRRSAGPPAVRIAGSPAVRNMSGSPEVTSGDSPAPDTRCSGDPGIPCSCVWKSGGLGFRALFRDCRTPGPLDLRISGYPDFQTSAGHPAIAGALDRRFAGSPDRGIASSPDRGMSGSPGRRMSGMSGCPAEACI